MGLHRRLRLHESFPQNAQCAGRVSIQKVQRQCGTEGDLITSMLPDMGHRREVTLENKAIRFREDSWRHGWGLSK